MKLMNLFNSQKGFAIPILVLGVALVMLVLAGGYFYSNYYKTRENVEVVQPDGTNETPYDKVETTSIPSLDSRSKIFIEIRLEEGQTVQVPGTEIKIKAIWVSEICKNVPPPDCKDEATLEFSHIEFTRGMTLYIGGISLQGQEASNVETFFGHRIKLTSLKGKQIALSIEIPEEIPGSMPGWLTYRKEKFELQYPKIFELKDRGKAADSTVNNIKDMDDNIEYVNVGYDYLLTLHAQKSNKPEGVSGEEQVTILIYNNVPTDLDEFVRTASFEKPFLAPKKKVIANKEMREVLSTGLERNLSLFWVDPSKQRGVEFIVDPNAENLEDFYKIIQYFKFLE